jgi:predicted dehydrogenase
VDTDPARASRVQASFPAARAADDDTRALADPALNAVNICLPHHLHAPVALAAAQAGKHILVEKPLAATLDEADQMVVKVLNDVLMFSQLRCARCIDGLQLAAKG